MADSANPETAYALRLVPPGAQLPNDQALKAPEGTRAVASFGERVDITVALPDAAPAVQRWAADQVIRKVASAVSLGEATLVAEGLPGALVETVALDLHHRSGGRLSLPGQDALAAEVARIGALEDLCRDWVNEDPSTRTSIAIARDVETFAAEHEAVTATVFAEEELRERGMNLILAVGSGSEASPPRLVAAEYRPEGAEGPPLMLLGKGITFDSGGINVKPYESYVSCMKNDMAGAATAWSLFRGLVESGCSRPLLVVLPTCENAVDGKSMRPGAIVTGYAGKSVRIDHTDAEGRLVLADGLAWASEQFAPEQIICFATLTTAALIAYGPYATPVHFAEGPWQQAFADAAEATAHDLHFFPRRAWHHEANRDPAADLRNTARLPGDASRGAGSRNAAHFLGHFTDRPFIHLDIFASAWNWPGDFPGAAYGATGAPVRTVLHALESVLSPDYSPSHGIDGP